jgi:hypothetical protein
MGEHQPQRLDYQSPKDAPRRRGPTRAARVGAAVCAALLPAWATWEAHVIERGQIRVRTFRQPAILLMLVLAAFCLLVAVGVFGKGRGEK